MRELPNLRKIALAVQVPEYAANFEIKDTEDTQALQYDDYVAPAVMRRYLPPGSWVILGRANELKVYQIEVLTLKTSYDGAANIFWQDYCSANGLTNELILCEQ